MGKTYTFVSIPGSWLSIRSWGYGYVQYCMGSWFVTNILYHVWFWFSFLVSRRRDDVIVWQGRMLWFLRVIVCLRKFVFTTYAVVTWPPDQFNMWRYLGLVSLCVNSVSFLIQGDVWRKTLTIVFCHSWTPAQRTVSDWLFSTQTITQTDSRRRYRCYSP